MADFLGASTSSIMSAMTDLAKLLMIFGVVLFAAGLLLYFGTRLPWFGNLPGDIVVKRDNFTLYAPLGTMVLVSILLTVLLNLLSRWWK